MIEARCPNCAKNVNAKVLDDDGRTVVARCPSCNNAWTIDLRRPAY